MKMLWRMGPAVIALALAAGSAFAEQRDFPTGEPNTGVTYLAAGGPDNPTGCIVSVMSGLPALAFSFSVYSNNTFTIFLMTKQPIPPIAVGSDATVKVNTIYLFSKVAGTSTTPSGIHLVSLTPIESTELKPVYDAINQIAYNPTRVDAVADDAQLPSINIPPAPGIGDALTACQQYLISHYK